MAEDEVMELHDLERGDASDVPSLEDPDDVSWEMFTDDETDELDTTAEQLAHGKDIQGIPWQELQFTRAHYRVTRIKQYSNYTNLIPQGSTEYK
jgi:hypothetical protein